MGGGKVVGWDRGGEANYQQMKFEESIFFGKLKGDVALNW